MRQTPAAASAMCALATALWRRGLATARGGGVGAVVALGEARVERVLAKCAAVRSTDIVLEVGAGQHGDLTRALLDEGPVKVVTVEPSAQGVAVLRRRFGETVPYCFHSRVITTPLARFRPPSRVDVVVSARPDCMSTRVLRHLVHCFHRHRHRSHSHSHSHSHSYHPLPMARQSLLVFPNSFAQRLLATPGSERYAVSSVLMQTEVAMDVVGEIEPGMLPAVVQKTGCSLIRLRSLPQPSEVSCERDVDAFEQFLQLLFSNSNKTLRALMKKRGPVVRSLAHRHGVKEERVHHALHTALSPHGTSRFFGPDGDLRPTHASPTQLAHLYDAVAAALAANEITTGL